MSMDPLRIYVIWDEAASGNQADAREIAQQFDGIGMQRDGHRFHVPVRVRYTPSPRVDRGVLQQAPRGIELDRARLNVFVVLYDDRMADNHDAWNRWLDGLRAEVERTGRKDLFIIQAMPGTRRRQFACLPYVQGLPSDDPAAYPDPAAAGTGARGNRYRTRWMLRVVNAIHRQWRTIDGRAGADRNLRVFVSHAKHDGVAYAEQLTELATRINNDLNINIVFDRAWLIPGADYREEFVQTISDGALLVLATDTYHERTWCHFETLTAKRTARPVVVADLAAQGAARTFPYIGNVPSLRVVAGEDVAEPVIEQLLLMVLLESLRVTLWTWEARQRVAVTRSASALTFVPRPPELLDLCESVRSRAPDPVLVIYPDPPIGQHEREFLSAAMPGVDFRALSEVAP